MIPRVLYSGACCFHLAQKSDCYILDVLSRQTSLLLTETDRLGALSDHETGRLLAVDLEKMRSCICKTLEWDWIGTVFLCLAQCFVLVVMFLPTSMMIPSSQPTRDRLDLWEIGVADCW